MNNSINSQGSSGTPNQTLSSVRLIKYARIFLAENGRILLLQLGGMFIITFLFFIANLYLTGISFYSQASLTIHPSQLPEYKDFMWSTECGVMTFFLGVFSILAGSSMFASMSTKHSRQATILTPASQFEKFLTWFVVYLPVCIIAGLVCFYVADILRVCWAKWFTDFGEFARVIPLSDVICLTTEPLRDNGAFNHSTLFSISLSYSVYIILNGLFALGSIFFHRISLIKSAVLYFVIFQICGILSFVGTLVFFDNGNFTLRDFISESTFATSVTCWIITLIIAVILYGLSYMRMKESEIISRW